MKHIKLFESFNDFPNTKEEIVKICKKYSIKNYTINDDMSIDVDGDVNLVNRGLDKLPLEFNNVRINFNCNFNKLTTLEGAPKEVGGDFNCNINQLTTLEGCPLRVGGGFYCSNNQLTDLKFAPEIFGGDFYCPENKLVTLLGSPWKVGGDFNCSNNQLTDLKFAPKIVGGDFGCGWNWSLISLVGGPNIVGGDFNFNPSPIYSLYTLFDDYKWFKESIKEYSWLDGTEIDKMRLIDVFLDENLPEPDLSKIHKIYTLI